ncbi:hypothetical protein [Aminivibrio sp.]|uniref:hypothetical protein n=1 Tax=Aminivibrio sp. TaxID=1872489 RepID=UPI003D9989EC
MPLFTRKKAGALLFLSLFIVVTLAALGAECAEQAPKNDVTRAEFFLKKFEDRVNRFRGQAFRLGYEDNEALKRIKELKEKYPDDPAVESLFQRGRLALMKSKGDFMEITPEMLVFRENEKKLKQLFGDIADREWKQFTEDILAGPTALPKAFPAPDRTQVSIEDIRESYVILDEFEYPANQFIDLGREFVSVGFGRQGILLRGDFQPELGRPLRGGQKVPPPHQQGLPGRGEVDSSRAHHRHRDGDPPGRKGQDRGTSVGMGRHSRGPLHSRGDLCLLRLGE